MAARASLNGDVHAAISPHPYLELRVLRSLPLVRRAALAACALAVPAIAGAQQCLGVPRASSVNATYLRSTTSPAATSSIGGIMRLSSAPIFGGVEAGRIESGSALTTDAGRYVNVLVGWAPAVAERVHPCVTVGRTMGSEPTANGVTAPSLDATVASIGTSIDLIGRGDDARVALFASWYEAMASGATSSSARAGIAYALTPAWVARAAYDQGVNSPSRGAWSVSIVRAWR